jgi:lipoprotein signal peptidase
MTIADLLLLWVPVVTIVIGLSFVFKDWPGWRWVETMIIGGGTGHVTVMAFQTLRSNLFTPLIGGNWILFPVVIFGVLMYFRFAPNKIQYFQRYGYAWIIGSGIGLVISTMIQGQILPVIKQTVNIPGATTIDTINNAIGFVIFVTVLSYFIFTVEHKPTLGNSGRIGRYFLMIAFGLGFSTLLMTYFGVLLERVIFIMRNLSLL